MSDNVPSNRRNHGGKRPSIAPIRPRRLSLSGDNDVAETPANAPVSKKSRSSPRHFKCCTTIPQMPPLCYCDGCSRCEASTKRKPREETKSREMQCCRAWTIKVKDVPKIKLAHWQSVTSYIENELRVDHNSFIDDSTPTTKPMAVVPVIPTPSPPPMRKVALIPAKVNSQGQEFKFRIPSSHRIVHKDHLKRWQNDSETLNNMRQKIQQNQCSSNTLFSQSLWGVGLSSVPSLALSAAQHLVPILVLSFFWDTGLFDYNAFNYNQHAKSFPSDNTLRKYTLLQATRDTIALGDEIAGKQMYLACDKANKKGVGHFVKVLSWWDQEQCRVVKRILDIDASGGASVDCAAAIQGSIAKLKANPDDTAHLVSGQTTDSGGGGTLEKLHQEMNLLGLCVPDDKYLTANCCIHALQTQLKNSTCTALGDGGLGNCNAMQLIHSVYDFQEVLDPVEWRHMLTLSTAFVLSHNNDTVQQQDAGTRTDAQRRHFADFCKQYDQVVAFHPSPKKEAIGDDDSAFKNAILGKMKAPILTRWWTVGVGAAYAFDYYLQLFHAAQTVVNLHSSDSAPNKIASSLYSLMNDQENFIDVTLIRCFNKAYINPNLDWLQDCDDLTVTKGFQPHNVAVRYFLMYYKLEQVLYDSQMKHYHAATKVGGKEQARHLEKLKVFIRASKDSLIKHFDRWVGQALLPCGLLSESPIARVVAAALLKEDMPTIEAGESIIKNTFGGPTHYESTAHKETINLNRLHSFLLTRIEKQEEGNGMSEYTPKSKQAAELTCGDATFDLRSMEHSEDSYHWQLRLHMHCTYLPLACQTQFIETGAKEAKIISSTDRSEQQRSAIAVIRSATPLGKMKEDEDMSYNANKIVAIIKSAEDRAELHENLQEQQEQECKERFDRVQAAMKTEHFRDKRLDKKIVNVNDNASNYKKQNVKQQVKPQDVTAAVSGFIPYGRLIKKRNMDDLKVELLYREVVEDEIPELISERIKLLKELKGQRLLNEIGITEKEIKALKTFKKLSAAPFKLTDD